MRKINLPLPPSAPKSTAHWLDAFALCASSLCTVHCLGLPLLFALLPAIATRIDPGESFHVAMLALAVPTSLFALARQWRRRGQPSLLIVGIAGLTMMAVGAFLTEQPIWETIWTIGGSALLATAHILNWRSGRALVD